MGSLQILVVFHRGTFWVLPLTYFYLPQSARAYLFPQSVKSHYFCSGPISADPIRPQPSNVEMGMGFPSTTGDSPVGDQKQFGDAHTSFVPTLLF